MINPFEQLYTRIYDSLYPFLNTPLITPADAYFIHNKVTPDLKELSNRESAYHFDSETLEISYYKEHWIKLISTVYYISYFKNPHSLKKPWTNLQGRQKKKFVNEINLFINLNQGLYTYHLQSASHLDADIFRKDSIEKYSLARIISYCNLLENLDGSKQGQMENKLYSLKLATTKTNLVLLVYLIHHFGFFDPNTTSINTLANLFGQITGTDLKNVYELYSRSNQKTKIEFRRKLVFILEKQIIALK